MGIIFSRFRRKKETTFQILESLENRIKKIEDFQRDTEQRQKTVVGLLIVYSVGIYVLFSILFYFYNFHENLKGKLLCMIPLLIFPVIVVLIKKVVTWYFNRKIRLNQEKLSEMKDEKRRMLENVKDKETYKIAKEILEKFAPDQLRRPMPIVSPTASKVKITSESPPNQLANSPSADLRKRGPIASPPGPQRPAIMGPPGSSPVLSVSPANQGQFPMHRGPPMPRPVLPRDRGYLDKLVEYIVGDGPSNRYALVCRQCHSHNGMALKEEFEYLAFRCCYCYQWNPARKQRPTAPRLQPSLGDQDVVQTSGSELESNTDTTDDSGGEDLPPKESQSPERDTAVNGVHVGEMTSSPSESGAETSGPVAETNGALDAPSEAHAEPAEVPEPSLDEGATAALDGPVGESAASLDAGVKESSSSDLYLSDL